MPPLQLASDRQAREALAGLYRQYVLLSPGFTSDAWMVVKKPGAIWCLNASNRQRTTYAAVQLTPTKAGWLCYLLDIGLDNALHGRGLGFTLYRRVEAFARLAGCSWLIQTPSGWAAYDGKLHESRADYVVRKLGYTMVGIEAIKCLATTEPLWEGL